MLFKLWAANAPTSACPGSIPTNKQHHCVLVLKCMLCSGFFHTLCTTKQPHALPDRHQGSLCNRSLKLEQYKASGVEKKKRANLMQPVGSFAIVSMCKYVLVHCNAFVRPPYKSTVCAHAQAPFISVISRCICWTSTKAEHKPWRLLSNPSKWLDNTAANEKFHTTAVPQLYVPSDNSKSPQWWLEPDPCATQPLDAASAERSLQGAPFSGLWLRIWQLHWCCY